MPRLSERMFFLFPLRVPSSKDVEPLDLSLLQRQVDAPGAFDMEMVAQTPPSHARDHFRIQSSKRAWPTPLPLPEVSPSQFPATPNYMAVTPPADFFSFPLSASPRPSSENSEDGLKAFRCSEERLQALAQGLVQAGLQENPEEKILRTLHHFFKGNITDHSQVDKSLKKKKRRSLSPSLLSVFTLPADFFPSVSTSHRAMATLGDKIRRVFRNDATFTTFEFSRIMEDKGVMLAEALKTNSTLTALFLGWNQLGDEGAGRLAEALAVNSTLVRLHLCVNNIEDEGAGRLAKALVTNSTLSYLDLATNEIKPPGAGRLGETLITNSTLTTLILRMNSLGDEGAARLAEALTTNSALTTLNLDRNYMKNVGAGWLAEALKTNSTLTTLVLGENQVGDEGAERLAEALAANSTLTTLDLSGNRQVGYEGVKRFAEALTTNSTLSILNLQSIQLGEARAAGAKLLVEALATNSSLTQLRFEWDRMYTSIVRLAESYLHRNQRNMEKKTSSLFFILLPLLYVDSIELSEAITSPSSKRQRRT